MVGKFDFTHFRFGEAVLREVNHLLGIAINLCDTSRVRIFAQFCVSDIFGQWIFDKKVVTDYVAACNLLNRLESVVLTAKSVS